MLSKKNKTKIDKLVKSGATANEINKEMADAPVTEVKEYVESILQKALEIPGRRDGKKKGVVIMTQAASELGDEAKKINRKNTLENNSRYRDCITEIKKAK